MKKLSIILAFVLCASVLFCTPASAAGEEVRLYVKARGTEVTAWVKTSASVGALQGAIKYAESDFAYESAVANSGISANNETLSSFRDASGATKVALVGNPSSGTTGDWATITYSAEEGALTDFDFVNVKAFAAGGAKLTPVVKVVRPGDLNEDKVVNIYDYVHYKLIRLNQVSAPTVRENMDIDMNGYFDNNNNDDDSWITADYQNLRKDILDN